MRPRRFVGVRAVAVCAAWLVLVLVAASVPPRLAGGPEPRLFWAAVAFVPSLGVLCLTASWGRFRRAAGLSGAGSFALVLLFVVVSTAFAGSSVLTALMARSLWAAAGFGFGCFGLCAAALALESRQLRR